MPCSSSGIERVHAGEEDVNGFFDFESMLDMHWPAKRFFLPAKHAEHAKKGSFYLKPFVYPEGRHCLACLVGPQSLPFSLVHIPYGMNPIFFPCLGSEARS
jgi:hypothetical protein